MDGTYDAQAGTRFPTTKWREGYDVASVDEFVARAERAVSFRDGSVRSEDVVQVRFAPVRWRTGYDMDAVDTHLEQLVADLKGIES
jgi:DivIVA domain-containing protein